MDKKTWLGLLLVAIVPGGVIGYAIWWISKCKHKNSSFPFRRKGEQQVRVTCFDCARVFEYDWHKMKMGKEIVQNAKLRTNVPSNRALGLVTPVPETQERFR